MCRSLIPIVEAAVEADCKFRRELPALLQLTNRPRQVDRNLGSLGNMSSTYRDNFNTHKELSFSNDVAGFAYTKTEEPMNKKNLNNAAQALYAGTTKSTHHLPGFKGHIPTNVRNTRKLEHSCGENHHPVANNLRLTQRGMGCVLGYTGTYLFSSLQLLNHRRNIKSFFPLHQYEECLYFSYFYHDVSHYRSVRSRAPRDQRPSAGAHHCLRSPHHQRRVIHI